jgi:hypothetical protein
MAVSTPRNTFHGGCDLIESQVFERRLLGDASQLAALVARLRPDELGHYKR